MSRASDAKKARRKKRQAASGPSADSAADQEFDEVARAVAVVNEWIVGRGWLLDEENSGDELMSWVYPPSAAEFDDDTREPVTRIWISVEEDDDAVVLEFGAALVGTGDVDDVEDGLYLLDPETMVEDITALEAYRLGEPLPVLEK